MFERGLASFLITLGVALHGVPPIALMAAVLIAWLVVTLADATPALTILLTTALLLIFAIEITLFLTPRF